jgi:predicted ATP-binding protein involved in virulence
MNERIEELAEQAGVESNFNGYNAWYNEKFAELIVRECQLRVERYIYECGEVASMPDAVIMKHFGIKE